MPDPHWEKLKEIFHEAVALAPVERAVYLDRACGGDSSLRAAIESLLQSHEQSNFIDTPAYEAAAEMVSDDLNIKPGQTIAHYRIVSLIGEGGMGKVYLAEDTNLHRRISLKFLNRSFSADSERVRRFQQEARAVSALNQPNILTIYEVGEVDGHRFIATEYIEGRTLREAMISGLDVDAALDIAIQVASSLVAAHRVKIIHRDIKPENIMIREEDGVVKVLDFGLAKISAPTPPVVDSIDREADTRLRANTKPGVVMGTVAYMSPEQARGGTVDERTDIWSLGVVLYEMVAGCSPFMAGTSNEIISTILAKTPAAPLSRYAPDVPTRLADIVEKALAKNKDDRYQTSKDLLIDLKRLKQSLDTKAAIERSTSPDKPVVSPAGGSRKPKFVDQAGTSNTQAVSSAEYVVGEIRRHKRGVVIAVAVLLSATAGIAYGLIELWKRSQARPATPAQSIKITKLTDSGKTTAAAISPDGNYVVYALESEGKQSLWLRQVSPTSEREIVPAAPVYIRGLTFSKDGNLIYYTGSERENVFESAALYQVAALGGTPRKVMARVSSPITFSPDQNRIAFVRDREGSGAEEALMIANVDGTQERILAQHKGLAFFNNSGPAWSPDGKVIACGDWFHPNGRSNSVVAVNVDDGTEKPMTSFEGWTGPVDRLTWLRDGSGLIVLAATDVISGSQVWHLAYPSGEVRRITNDLNSYGEDSLTLTSDSTALAVVQQDATTNFWLMKMNEDASRARQISHGRFGAGGGSLAWTPDGKIVFARRTGDLNDLWTMDEDGTNQRQLTAGPTWEAYPMFSPDGRYLVVNTDRDKISHIWRFDADATNPKQLTNGNAEDYSPVFTPDGRWVLFSSWRSGKLATWKVSIDGGAPVQLAQQDSPYPIVSPDGKMFASGYHDNDPNSPWRLAIFPIDGGQPAKLFDITLTTGFGRGLFWTADGKALLYADTRSGVSNLWSQSVDGGPPRQLTNFKSELIFRFALSPDGRQIVLKRGTQTRDVVLIKDFR